MTEKKPIGARPTLEERLDEIVRECVAEVVQSARQIIEAGKQQDAINSANKQPAINQPLKAF